jgi:hypothetical protein
MNINKWLIVKSAVVWVIGIATIVGIGSVYDLPELLSVLLGVLVGIITVIYYLLNEK